MIYSYLVMISQQSESLTPINATWKHTGNPGIQHERLHTTANVLGLCVCVCVCGCVQVCIYMWVKHQNTSTGCCFPAYVNPKRRTSTRRGMEAICNAYSVDAVALYFFWDTKMNRKQPSPCWHCVSQQDRLQSLLLNPAFIWLSVGFQHTPLILTFSLQWATAARARRNFRKVSDDASFALIQTFLYQVGRVSAQAKYFLC